MEAHYSARGQSFRKPQDRHSWESSMSTFLDIALEHARRGWFVFPCIPRTKRPLIKDNLKQASRDEAQIRAWWTQWPEANIGIACGLSGLSVFDVDHGLTNRAGFDALCTAMNLPETYAVRTGRRDDYGVQ